MNGSLETEIQLVVLGLQRFGTTRSIPAMTREESHLQVQCTGIAVWRVSPAHHRISTSWGIFLKGDQNIV